MTNSLPNRRLGRTGREVGALGLGAYQLTSEFSVPEEEALRIFDAAAKAGINYVDTAPAYAKGKSEHLLGRALSEIRSWHPFLSTKVGYLPSEADYRDPRTLRASVERSLDRLGVDRVDIVMIHEPEFPQWALQPDGSGVVTDVLRELRDEGLISHLGLGGWDFSRIAELIDGGIFDVALVAGGYTLLHQPIRDEVLPAAERNDVGIAVGGAFAQGASGLLAVDRAPIQEMLRTGEYRPLHPSIRFDRRTCERLLNLYDLAEEFGIGMPELTIRYILSETRIHTHVAGAREDSHLRANLDAVSKGPLSAELLARIEVA